VGIRATDATDLYDRIQQVLVLVSIWRRSLINSDALHACPHVYDVQCVGTVMLWVEICESNGGHSLAFRDEMVALLVQAAHEIAHKIIM